MTKVNYEQAVPLYELGLTTTEIGDIFGASHSAVGVGLRRRGVTLRPSHSPSFNIHEAAKMYEQGKSLFELQDIFKVAHQNIYIQLRKMGVKFKGSPTGEDSSMYRGGAKADKAAKDIVAHAIKKGSLIRPDNCSECGDSGEFKDGRSKVEAHHDDYNYPLAVRWLCRKCHHNWHRNNKAILQEESTDEPI